MPPKKHPLDYCRLEIIRLLLSRGSYWIEIPSLYVGPADASTRFHDIAFLTALEVEGYVVRANSVKDIRSQPINDLLPRIYQCWYRLTQRGKAALIQLWEDANAS